MSKLIKNMIWPTIILGVLISIVYYRAFLFTEGFNSPVDVVINEASKSLNVKIPAHELSDNEKPLYNRLFGDNDVEADDSSLNDRNAEAANIKITADTAEQQTISPIETEKDLNLEDIVDAVKNTVNDALKIFKEENIQTLNAELVEKSSVLTESEMLFKARLAYWNHDLKIAEETYKKLIETAEDANAYGELGNLYYMQSKWKKASDAYYHAAMQLKTINHIDQAYHLLRIIRGLDSETANKLQTELQHSS